MQEKDKLTDEHITEKHLRLLENTKITLTIIPGGCEITVAKHKANT